jgi:signal transduction histidine kinase
MTMEQQHQLKILQQYVCNSQATYWGEKAGRISSLGQIAHNLLRMEIFAILFASPQMDDVTTCLGTSITPAFLDALQAYLIDRSADERRSFFEQEIFWLGELAAPPEIQRLDVQAYLRFPIHVLGQVVGMVVLGSPKPTSRERLPLALVRVIVETVEEIVEGIWLRHENLMAIRLQESAYHLMRLMSSNADLPVLLDQVMRQAIYLTGAGGARILLAVDRTYLYTAARHGDIPVQAHLQRIPFGEGLDGQVAVAKRSMLVNDYAAYEHAVPEVANQNAVRSLLNVPMLIGDELLGVLSVHHSIRDHQPDFTEVDQQALEALAPLAAIAIDKVRLQDTLAQEHAQLQTILDHIRLPILLFDKQFRLVLANPEAHEVAARMKIPLEQCIGMTVTEIAALSPYQLKLPPQLLMGQTQEIQLPETGEFLLRVAEVRGKGGEIEGLVVVAHEVSEERDLNRIRSELLHILSHDLGNIISLALGYVALMVEEPVEGEEYRIFIGRVYDALNRGKTLIRDVVEIEHARVAGRRLTRPYDVKEVLDTVFIGVADLLRIHQQDFRFNILRAPARPLMGNVVLIKQMFENLLNNASKYTPDGGKIEVTLNSDDQYAIVAIADTGIGIPEKDLPHIWERFYRVETTATRNVQGSGLGLSLVQSVLEAHAGHVEVESEVGKGTTFRVYLPFDLPESLAEPPAEAW